MTAPALLLDFDGTLCCSVGPLRRAYHAFLGAHGRTGSDAEFDSLNGPPLAEIVARLVRHHRLPGTPETLLAHYRELVRQAQTGAPPAPGAARLLAAARARGYRLAVVTSSDRAEVSAWMAAQGLAVDAIIGGGDAAAGKPDPAPYRLGLHRLGAEAADSLAVEDGAQGARAALGARLRTAFLGRSLPHELAGHPLLRGPVGSLDGVIPLL